MVQFKKVFVLLLSLSRISFYDCLPLEDDIFSNSPELSGALIKFDLFKETFNVTYPSFTEELKRFKIFLGGLKEIARLNLLQLGTAEFGVTQFMDKTPEEFEAYLGGAFVPERLSSMLGSMEQVELGDVAVPAEFDWRSEKTVTPVKQQGECGSCWAFSTVANVENCYAIKYKKQKIFSEQQLVDCDERSYGCDGGWPENAIQSIIEKGGMNTESSYPYEGEQKSCRFKKGNLEVTVTEGVRLESENEDDMAKYIATESSTINAINARFLQYYKSGIISASRWRCSPRSLNHAVTVVGYGKGDGIDYWIVKNSWGTGWGEKGYFRIEKGSNTCGISSYAWSVIVD